MRIRRHLHRAALVALSLSLLGQPILAHLHALAESDVSLRLQSNHATASTISTDRKASPTPDTHHDTSCPLCIARAQSRAQALAPTIVASVPVVTSPLPLPAIAVPPARPAQRAPSLRGPPAAV